MCQLSLPPGGLPQGGSYAWKKEILKKLKRQPFHCWTKMKVNLRWTIRDIFIHINSFPKIQQNKEYWFFLGMKLCVSVVHGSGYILILVPIPIPGKFKCLIPVPIPAQFDFVDSDSNRIDSESGDGTVHHWCVLYENVMYGQSQKPDFGDNGQETLENRPICFCHLSTQMLYNYFWEKRTPDTLLSSLSDLIEFWKLLWTCLL